MDVHLVAKCLTHFVNISCCRLCACVLPANTDAPPPTVYLCGASRSLPTLTRLMLLSQVVVTMLHTIISKITISATPALVETLWHMLTLDE